MPHHRPFPVPANTNGKNDKKDNGGFSFGATLFAPPKSGGVYGFIFQFSSSSDINSGVSSVSGNKD